MLAPVTHILPLTNIRRVRALPVAGRVLVRQGQKVNASDVIAQARIPSGHNVLDIRRGLGILQASAAERCIVRQVGDRLEKGDVIAESGGLFSRIVRSPAEGEIVSIHGGQVLLRVKSAGMEVIAGFEGTVAEILKDQGAVIETNGALIQGVWGNGRIDSGLLLVVAHAPDDELTSQQIDVSMRGAVVLGGYCASADVLRLGGELPLRGLVVSSLSSELVPLASSLNYPVVVLEGFGKIRMNDAAYKLLMTSEKRDVSVSAAFNPAAGERPELIIPLPAIGQTAPETDYFAPGQTVRIQGAPFAGKVGSIVQLRQGLYMLPNGLKVLAADIQLDADTRVTVPLANLEVIE
ncbi:MAG TPA: hypothetical protein VF806_01240 [Anaerolineaceae bacterium]